MRALARGKGADAGVEARDGVPLPRLAPRVENAERGLERALEAVDENVGAGALAKRREKIDHRLGGAVGLGLDLALREIGEAGPKVRRDVAQLHGEDDRVRLRGVERARRVQDVLAVGVEVADPRLDAAAVEGRLRLQHRHHGLDRERAQERDAMGRDRGLPATSCRSAP